MEVETRVEGESNGQIKYETDESESNVLNNITYFHQQGLYSDLVIFCGNQKFHCHKLVLASRSDAFKKILPTIGSELEVSDASPVFFKVIIDNIYTRKIPDNLDRIATDVFPLASKYNLGNLSKACEQILLKHLTNENALETLVLMEHYKSSESTKNEVINYIIINAKDMINTDRFKAFAKEHSDLMIEIFKHSLSNRDTTHGTVAQMYESSSTCNDGHPLQYYSVSPNNFHTGPGRCDKCGDVIYQDPENNAYRCGQCDYDLCRKCKSDF